MNRWRNVIGVLGLAVVLQTTAVGAAQFSSTHYKIDGVIGGSYGGYNSSSSYALSSTGGESIVGKGTGGSYIMGQGYTAQLENSMQLTAQPVGLAAYYSAEANAGSVLYDNSANANNASFTTAPTWVAGKIGKGIQVNGTTQYGVVANHASINIGTVTLSVWVKTNATAGSDQTIIEKRNAGTGAFPYAMRYTSSGTVYCSNGDGTSTATASTNDKVNDNRWHHIMCTLRPSGTVTMYLDGDQKGQATASLGTTTNTSGVGIGARADGAQFFSGSVDEIKLYSRIFTLAEVRAEYDAESRGYTAGASIGAVTPGTSKTADLDTIVRTDAPGYSVAVSQDGDLTNGSQGATADFSQNFNSFGNGTTMTTGNTGFDNFSVSGTATFTSSTAAPAPHSTFGRIVATTTSTDILRKDFTSTADRYFRFTFKLSSIPAATQTIFSARASTTSTANIRIQNDGTLQIRNGAISVATSTNAVQPNQWVRLEYHYNSDTQVQTLRIYNDATSSIDATAPDETISGAATNGPIDNIQLGLVTTQASQTMDLDDIAMSTVGWLGPAGSDTISAIASGTIATPVLWSEGTTKGLGFTLTSAPSLDAKWSSGTKFAAFPGSATSFYTRTGLTSAVTDAVTMRTRLDVASTQAPGGYANTITITGTMIP